MSRLENPRLAPTTLALLLASLAPARLSSPSRPRMNARDAGEPTCGGLSKPRRRNPQTTPKITPTTAENTKASSTTDALGAKGMTMIRAAT